MKPEIDEEGFIVGVFNYCDRWCERCRFAMRCRVYDDISDENGNIRDLSMEETLEEVAGSFGKTFELLYNWAEEEGIDLNELTEDSEDWQRERKIRDAKVDESPLSQATSAYSEMARQWLEENRSLFEQKLKELGQQVDLDIDPAKQVNTSERIRDAIEVIQFYLFPIHIKTSRALLGLYDDKDYWDDPIQNDYNGSAKVALLETERSLQAFETLFKEFSEQDDCLPIMAQLEKIRKALMAQFPDTQQFIRSGFDTLELV